MRICFRVEKHFWCEDGGLGLVSFRGKSTIFFTFFLVFWGFYFWWFFRAWYWYKKFLMKYFFLKVDEKRTPLLETTFFVHSFGSKIEMFFSWNYPNPKYFQCVKPPVITILKPQNILKYQKKIDFSSKFWKYFDFFRIFWHLPVVKFCTITLATFWDLGFDPKIGLFWGNLWKRGNYVVFKGVFNLLKQGK